jgi:2-polyprenyl-3-methyl-5-hydroxy-6-metoxy-1,4-benzoquinol methylase
MKCLLCGSDQQKIFAGVESFGFPLVYYQCNNCGLIFQSPEESQASNPEFYRKTYRKIYQTQEEPTKKDLWIQQKRAEHFIKILQSQLDNSPKRTLGIGASAGVLLKQIHQVFDSDVIGVEPGEAYRDYAEATGIEMRESMDALMASKPGRFDLVCMSHVLEHLKHPVKFLGQIKSTLLKDEGHLLLEVPNFYAHDSYELAHLACYTPHTLGEVLKQSGFNIVYSKNNGIPRSQLLNLYLTRIGKINTKSERPTKIKKENLVGLKRNISMLYRRFVQKLFPHKAWLPIAVIDNP